tara:strand:- start:189 stop:1118 length:930 start_codon:yes stop_codon:yes gene_type:complete
MDDLKICLVGFGGIARRYIKILEKIMISHKLKFHIDVIRSGKSLHINCPEKYNVIGHNIKNKYLSYDLVFIVSTYPVKLLHLKQLINSKLIFIDKTVFTNKKEETDFLNTIGEHNFSKIYVGYCLRYHPQFMRALKLFQEKKDIVSELNLTYQTNMREWRKDIKFSDSAGGREFFNGGGAVNELSHEVDLLFNFLDINSSYSPKVVTEWDYLLKHDKSFEVKILSDNVKYKAFVDTSNQSFKRVVEIKTQSGKIYRFDLFLKEEIDEMYYEMILDIFLKVQNSKRSIRLPSINNIKNITSTIEKIHKSY